MPALTDTEKAVLDFEAQTWRSPGAKETAIVETFGWLAARHYQVLGALLDRVEAQEYAPMTVKRLRRLREARRAVRSTTDPRPLSESGTSRRH